MKTADLYQSVTNQLITTLEAGTPPWVKPWSQMAEPMPCNAISLRPYRGINLLMLTMAADLKGYATPRWLTYRQAQQVGGHIRQGETATPVVYFALQRPAPVTLIEQEREASAKTAFYRRFFSVFNVDQCAGLPDELQQAPTLDPTWEACAMAEAIMQHSGAVIHQRPGNQAFYAPGQDWIVLPERSQFPQAEWFYSTALHELVHWSGHASRLDRPLGKGSEPAAYAKEELVAELGSAFLSAHCRLYGVLHHASYLQSWLELLREDRHALFKAASQAQRASDFLLGQAERLSEPESALAA